MAWRNRLFFRHSKGCGKRRKKWIQSGGTRAAAAPAIRKTVKVIATGAFPDWVAPDIRSAIAAR